MNRTFDFSLDEFYHIYSRGVDKRIIFLETCDKDRFVKLLYLCNGDKPTVFKSIQGETLDKIDVGRKIVSIGAYCLMDNHFHILLKEIVEGGISKFMMRLLTAYSMYFNKKNKRTGSLFESEFKAKHLDIDVYLKYILSYIHLNPIKMIQPDWKENGIADKIKAKSFLDKYNYSSYSDYLGVEREEGLILDKKGLPEYFREFKDFENFIDEWLFFTPDSEIQGLPLDTSKGRPWIK
jgi:putative transposase